MDKDKKVLKEIIEAWEYLPEGKNPNYKIQNWLRGVMKPVMDKAREQIKPDQNLMKKEPQDILSLMLDIETLGTGPNSIILEIGAVQFNPKTGETFQKFSAYPTVQSCVDTGLTLDEPTFLWWLDQSKEAREAIVDKSREPLENCLKDLKSFVQHTHVMNPRHARKVDIWANPPHFDIARLEEAYSAVGVEPAWGHRWIRCCRTVWNDPVLSEQTFTPNNFGPRHTAIADCHVQVQKLRWAMGLKAQLTRENEKIKAGLGEPKAQPPKVSREVTVYKEDMTVTAWYHLLFEAGLIETKIPDPSMRNLTDPSFVTEKLTEEELLHWNSREVRLYSVVGGEK